VASGSATRRPELGDGTNRWAPPVGDPRGRRGRGGQLGLGLGPAQLRGRAGRGMGRRHENGEKREKKEKRKRKKRNSKDSLILVLDFN
jgi:hypothetical protein